MFGDEGTQLPWASSSRGNRAHSPSTHRGQWVWGLPLPRTLEKALRPSVCLWVEGGFSSSFPRLILPFDMATEPPAGCYLDADLTDKGSSGNIQQHLCILVSLTFFPVIVPGQLQQRHSRWRYKYPFCLAVMKWTPSPLTNSVHKSKPWPPVSQNVRVVGDGPFKEVIKVKWGHGGRL